MARKRAYTVTIDRDEVDFMILEYSCRDSSVLQHLGKHCKESRWRIAVGSDALPVEIKVQVDKQIVTSHSVFVEYNGLKVLPSTVLKEDFTHSWPFRGTVKNLGTKHFYQVRPEFGKADEWYAATLTKQLDDALFKAILWVPNGKGAFEEVAYPAVKACNIREAASQTKVKIPQRALVLSVPKDDPMRSTLCIDGSALEMMTHFFARPTPAANQYSAAPKISFDVSKDRKWVAARCPQGPVGHHRLTHFLSGEVRRISETGAGQKRTWTFAVGPFAEHIVTLEKKSSGSRLYAMFVDGQLLVESQPEEIECSTGLWECTFRFVGQRQLEWELFETDGNGTSLDSRGKVLEASKFTHEVEVRVELDQDISTAKLSIDNRPFASFTEMRMPANEDAINVSTDALRGTYGIIVPWKVCENVPPTSFASAFDFSGIMAAVSNMAKDISKSIETATTPLRSTMTMAPDPAPAPAPAAAPAPSMSSRAERSEVHRSSVATEFEALSSSMAL